MPSSFHDPQLDAPAGADNDLRSDCTMYDDEASHPKQGMPYQNAWWLGQYATNRDVCNAVLRDLSQIGRLQRATNSLPHAPIQGGWRARQSSANLFSLPAIRYYTCFLSFSIADQLFVKRLYDDLQASGVHCWYFPEDVKIGDKIYERVDESIRLCDKLVLVLSETSVNSEWIEREVDIALAKEKSTQKQVLFPIRLDDSVMTATRYWARAIGENRHIGDCSQWQDFARYQSAMQRMLRDLQVPAVAMLHT